MEPRENRQIARESLFVVADLVVAGVPGEFRIKVRNISPGGMMGEGSVGAARGAGVRVNLRNIGWVPGNIVWVQDNRFGVAFADEIDPAVVREPAEGED
jgi:hypothetical protein